MLQEQIWAQGIKRESKNQEFPVSWVSGSCAGLLTACGRAAGRWARGSPLSLRKGSAPFGSSTIKLWKICFCFTDTLHENAFDIPHVASKVLRILFSHPTVFRRKLLVLSCMFSGLLCGVGHRAVTVPLLYAAWVYSSLKKTVTENSGGITQNKNHSWKESNYNFHKYWPQRRLQRSGVVTYSLVHKHFIFIRKVYNEFLLERLTMKLEKIMLLQIWLE